MRLAAAALLAIATPALANEAFVKMVQCEGQFTSTIGDRPIGSAQPYTAILRWAPDEVTVVEGGLDSLPKRYAKSVELTNLERAAFTSSGTSLFFYLESGRIETLSVEVPRNERGLLTRRLQGTCKKYQPSDVFK